MSSRVTTPVTITLPRALVEELDRVRRREHRTRSELMREALKRYVAEGAERRIPIVDPERGEIEALAHGRAQTARGEYVTLAELLDDLDADRRTGRGKKSQTVAE